MKYRKKPVVIEAFQLPALEDNATEAFEVWCDYVDFHDWFSGRDGSIDINTLEGVMTASPLDFIIKGIKGEFYPCKPDIFEATYEAVES